MNQIKEKLLTEKAKNKEKIEIDNSGNENDW